MSVQKAAYNEAGALKSRINDQLRPLDATNLIKEKKKEHKNKGKFATIFNVEVQKVDAKRTRAYFLVPSSLGTIMLLSVYYCQYWSVFWLVSELVFGCTQLCLFCYIYTHSFGLEIGLKLAFVVTKFPQI